MDSKGYFSFSYWLRTPKWLQKQAEEADTQAGWTIKDGEVISDSHELIDGWWVAKEKPESSCEPPG